MAGSSSSQGSTKEYVVRVPKTSRKKYHMMRFNAALGGEFFKNWSHCKIERENNLREFKEEDIPKFGAGSEYGRELKEEARRKRLGINKRTYKPDDQPWLLTIGGKTNKKRYKGIREGGVSDHTAWYVFMQGKDGAFEAYPVEEWYNFQPVQRYKALSAEEAEKEFEKRDQIMNFFQVMWEKRCRKEENDPEEEDGKKKGSPVKKLLLSEMDDWVDDDDDDDDDEQQLEGSDHEKAKKKKKKPKGKRAAGKGGKKTKREDGVSDDSCMEESDDYNEGAEHDYISGDSSDSDQENDEKVVKDLAGVEEGEALKNLLASDDEDDEEKEKNEKEEEEEDKVEESEEKDRKKKKKRKKDSRPNEDDSTDSSSDESKKKKPLKMGPETTVSKLKRKVKENPHEMPNSKKIKLGGGAAAAAGSTANNTQPSSDSAVSEEAIRRYLMRKPMTTTELLQKFKSKKTGLSSEQLVQSIAQILKRVNPVKQMVKGKMYLSIIP